MRVLAGIVLAVMVALSGCASIPLSTALSLSSLSPGSLAQVDPAQVRVKLSVPVGFELNIAATRLNLSLSASSGSRSTSMGLSLLSVTRESRPGGLFTADVPVSTYSLALSADGVRKLREMQSFMLHAEPKKFEFGVEAPFAEVPPSAREVTFWADLKLSLRDPFMPLINGARISFDGTRASS